MAADPWAAFQPVQQDDPWGKFQPVQQPAPKPAAPEGALARADGLVRSLARGATFGFADEIAAGGNAAVGAIGDAVTGNGWTFGERYDRNLAEERARDAAFEEAHPIASAAGNLTGGIVGPGKALGVIKAAPQGAAMAARLLRSGPVRGALAGASGGALGGFGEGQGGFEARLGGAGAGAALGGAGGAALTAGASLAGNIGGRVLHGLGLRNPEVAADRQVLRALDRDGQTVEQVQAALSPAGVPGVPAMAHPDGTILADVGGRNVTNLTATAANTPGEAMQAADQVVAMRREARPERFAEASNRAFGGGSGGDVADARAALMQQRSQEAAPLYEQAFSRPTGMTEALRVQTEDPIAQAGLRRGLEIQRIELATQGRRPDAMLGMDPAIQFDDDGTPRIVGELSTRSLDAIKRGLDDIMEGYRDPVTGRVNLDERGRTIDAFRRSFVGRVSDGNPAYSDARAAWAGPTQSMEAMQRGRQALTTDRDAAATVTGRLAPGDLPFYQMGVGRAVTDDAADPNKAPTFARRLLEDRNMQARVDLALPDPAARAGFRQEIGRERAMADVDNAISPRSGSQTARLLAGGDDMSRDPLGPWAAALLQASSGNIGGALMTAGRDAIRRGQGINPATAGALARRLLETNPDAQQAMLSRLGARQNDDAAKARMRAALVQQLLRGAGVSGGLALN